MKLYEKKRELAIMLNSKDGMSTNELYEGISECIELAFKESKNILVNARNHTLSEILKELKFGRPADVQALISKWIKELEGTGITDISLN